MQAGDVSKRPLFFVHPAGGNVLCYADLVRHLGPDRPFYGLQAQGLDGLQAPHAHVEEMARCYIESLRTVQPEGPYLLGGWSMGGVVAFEMAQQLQARGQPVALLALIDSDVPAGNPFEEDDVTILGNIALGQGLPIRPERLMELEPDERLALVLDEAKRLGVMPPDIELTQIRLLFHVFESNMQAVRRYTPRVYSGPITLFKAEVSLSGRAKDSDWSVLAGGGLTVYAVPGDHFTIARAPNIEILAGQLKQELDRIETVCAAGNPFSLRKRVSAPLFLPGSDSLR
jgi:thioesterase domain-containing protein